MSGLSVGLESSGRGRSLKHVSQGQPGAGLPFLSLRSGLELGGGAQILFSFGLTGLDQRKAQIEIRLEHVRLGRDRLTVGGDRVIGPAQRVVDKPQVEPGSKILRIVGDDLFQQRLRREVVFLLDRAFRLDEFRRGGWGHSSLGGRGYLFPFRTCARNFPVYEFGSFAMTSGEPAPTT